MKMTRLAVPVLATSALLLAGCSMKLVNLTPPTLPSNPSGLYTLSVKVDPAGSQINRNSVAASVIIDGETYAMEPSSMGGLVFDYDYRLPTGTNEVNYTYLVNYRMKRFDGDVAKYRERTSPPYTVEVTGRYAISLEIERAPIGTAVAVHGRGFSRSDRVEVGGVAAETRFISANSLEFIVPETTPGHAYPVEIIGSAGNVSAGNLRIDPASPLSVVPKSIDLSSGERVALVFALDEAAPTGGLFLNTTTDIPESVILPEVVVPAGARTVNVTVEGGEPGTGTLYVRAPGVTELQIPVVVQP